jgi:hypothetical protein
LNREQVLIAIMIAGVLIGGRYTTAGTQNGALLFDRLAIVCLLTLGVNHRYGDCGVTGSDGWGRKSPREGGMSGRV